MATDATSTVRTAKNRAHRAAKSTRRILTATVGFSAAYFLDPELGQARREQVLEFVRRAKSARLAATVGADPDLPRIGSAGSRPRPTFQRAVVDIRSVARA